MTKPLILLASISLATIGCSSIVRNALPVLPPATLAIAVTRGESMGDLYTKIDQHKAEAIALPRSRPIESLTKSPANEEPEGILSPMRFHVSGFSTPSSAALAALVDCEKARQTRPNTTLPCEIRRRNNQLIHSSKELLFGLKPDRKAFLWKLKNNKTTLYLAGSIHALKPSLELPPSYFAAFEEATTLVLELDQSSLTPEQQRAVVQRFALLPPDVSLRDLLAPNDHRMTSEYLKNLGIDVTAAERIRPSMLLLQAGLLEYQSIGYLAQYGVEQRFQDQLGNRELMGLETLEEQLEAATALPLELQAELLVETIQNAGSTSEQISALVHAWLSGNERYLHQQVESNTQSFATQKWLEDLLTRRNIVMADGIEALLGREGNEGTTDQPRQPLPFNDAQTFFILVGVAHLVGENSVIDLLARRGFAAQQLRQDSLQPAR